MSQQNKPYVYKVKEGSVNTCPHCGSGDLKDAPNKRYLLYCDKCNTYVDKFVPYGKQQFFLEYRDQSVYLLPGGKRSGKTWIAIRKVRDDAIRNQEVKIRMGAVTLKQLYEGIYLELLAMLPDEYILRDTVTEKSGGILELVNGTRITFSQTKDVGSLKTLEYFIQYYDEVTEGIPEFYQEVPKRSSGKNKQGEDGYIIFVTNSPDLDNYPEQIWFIKELWNKCGKVYWSPDPYDPPNKGAVNHEYVGFVFNSYDNPYLSDAYKKRAFGSTEVGSDTKETAGIVLTSSNRVYPNIEKAFEQPHDVNLQAPWYMSIDPGQSDKYSIGFYYIDPISYTIHKFHEISFNNQSYHYAVGEISSFCRKFGLDSRYEYTLPVIEYKAFTRERDNVAFSTKLARIGLRVQKPGIYYKPPRVEKVRNFIEQGRLKIFTTLEVTKEQHQLYIYKVDKKTKERKLPDGGDDACDETMNAMSIIPDNFDVFKRNIDAFMRTRDKSKKSNNKPVNRFNPLQQERSRLIGNDLLNNDPMPRMR